MARLPGILVLVALLASCVSPDPTPTVPGYGDLKNSPIRGLTPAEIESLETGAGAGLALAAELNGYPGPKHILELADDLGLTADQRRDVQDLYNRTNAEARRVGAEVLAAHRAVDDWFRANGTNVDDLRGLLDALGAREAELRAVHLQAHVQALPLLAPHQRALYGELRGYGAADHSAHH